MLYLLGNYSVITLFTLHLVRFDKPTLYQGVISPVPLYAFYSIIAYADTAPRYAHTLQILLIYLFTVLLQQAVIDCGIFQYVFCTYWNNVEYSRK